MTRRLQTFQIALDLNWGGEKNGLTKLADNSFSRLDMKFYVPYIQDNEGETLHQTATVVCSLTAFIELS